MRRLLAKGVLVDRERLTRIGGSILANADDRARQLRVVVDDARRSALPVIIAGDTNLPELSMVLARTFAGFQDAFGEVGSGFGYTFPANRRRLGPWMRIDRIFVSQALRVLDFTTLSPAGSDHLPVLAVLQRSP
jgi:endonuclease/exonuclease/phosphatase (EEP) superfamily protein YafD